MTQKTLHACNSEVQAHFAHSVRCWHCQPGEMAAAQLAKDHTVV